MPLTSQSEFNIIQMVSFPLSIISIISNLFMFYLYVYYPKLQILPFRMVVYLQFSDFMLSISQFLIFFESRNANSADGFCLFQAFLMQYGILATLLWSIMITTLMLLSFKYKTTDFEENENYFIFIGVYLPGLIAVMLNSFIFSSYFIFQQPVFL